MPRRVAWCSRLAARLPRAGFGEFVRLMAVVRATRPTRWADVVAYVYAYTPTQVMKTERIQLVITNKDRRAWSTAARRADLSLNEFVRQQVNAGLDSRSSSTGARAARSALRTVRIALEAAERALAPAKKRTRERR